MLEVRKTLYVPTARGCLMALLFMTPASVPADDLVPNQRFDGEFEQVSTLRTAFDASVDFDRVMGSRRSKVGILEFSDYGCAYARQFRATTFVVIRQRYIDTGKALYGYRDFPISLQPKDKAAPIAANCAGEQGAFWAMNRRLFENQGSLGDAYYKYLARHIQLNTDAFEACLGDPSQATRVDRDFDDGLRLGVRGTPYFLIGRLQNGVLTDVKAVTGAQPFSVFAEVIESLLN